MGSVMIFGIVISIIVAVLVGFLYVAYMYHFALKLYNMKKKQVLITYEPAISTTVVELFRLLINNYTPSDCTEFDSMELTRTISVSENKTATLYIKTIFQNIYVRYIVRLSGHLSLQALYNTETGSLNIERILPVLLIDKHGNSTSPDAINKPLCVLMQILSTITDSTVWKVVVSNDKNTTQFISHGDAKKKYQYPKSIQLLIE